MPLTELKQANDRKIGIKQSTRALMDGTVVKLYIAKDADPHVTRRIVALAEENQVPIIYVETMIELGSACNIDVGAATAVVIQV